MVLFLFVIMLLNLGDESEWKKHTGQALTGKRFAIAGATAAALALGGITAAGWGEPLVVTEAVSAEGIDDLHRLATVLFSRYMLPFEAASLLLLATMIGVLALAKRNRASVGAKEEGES